MAKELVGEITHYFTNIGVAVIKVSSNLKIGDKLSFEGANTNFQQPLTSMEIDREKIQEAKPGDDIGLKTIERVRPGDKVYKV